MKSVLKFSTILCFLIIAASCSKDDNPADNDLFVGTYKGKVSFHEDDKDISSDDSAVTVIKANNDYNFKFKESGIPMLKDVKFKKEGDDTLVNIDFKEGLQIVKISESKLTILYTKDGKTWTANMKR